MPASKPSTAATPDTTTPDGATPATTTPATERKPRAKREGAKPAQQMIAAMRRAWAAGVPESQCTMALDMAQSTGDSVKGWDMIVAVLNAYADQAEAESAKPESAKS